MYRFLFFFVFFGCSTSLIYQQLRPKNTTKHFELHEFDWQSIASSQPAFAFKNPDTSITHQMKLLTDAEGLPQLYYSDILTPVCIEGLCKPLYIELYWDLLGQYVGYGDYPDKPLTKYDHEIFESQDYLKLHNLLLDKSSVIGRRKLEQLYDSDIVRSDTITFKGVEVDGISGATRKEIRTSIVEGGLYSCYTLWHIVYGPASEIIRENISAIYSPAVADYFLRSTHKEYQYHAIKKMKPEAFVDNIEQIISFVKTASPLMRSYALKKMPKELFKSSIIGEQLYGELPSFDFNTQTLLLENLLNSNERAVQFASQSLPSFSKNQLILFLKTVQKLDAVESVREQLVEYTNTGFSSYSYLIDDIIDLDN